MAELHPVLTRLGLDHQRFAGVLGILQRSIESVDPDWLMVRDCLTYLTDYADEVHHRLEDVVFNQLLQADLEGAQHEAVVVNAKQHKTIAEASQRLLQDVDLVLADTVVPVERILIHLAQYLKVQRDHIRYENEYVFPLARQHIQAAGWDQISSQLLSVEDPVFVSRVDQFSRLYEAVVAQAELTADPQN